jgi:hypothetical protein
MTLEVKVVRIVVEATDLSTALKMYVNEQIGCFSTTRARLKPRTRSKTACVTSCDSFVHSSYSKWRNNVRQYAGK